MSKYENSIMKNEVNRALVAEKKQQYICPVTEVTVLGSDVIMQAFGPASMPDDTFNNAPAKKTEVF